MKTGVFESDFPKLSELYCEIRHTDGYKDWFDDLPRKVYVSNLGYQVYKERLEPNLAALEPNEWKLYKKSIVKGAKQRRPQLFDRLHELWGYRYLKNELTTRKIPFDEVIDPKLGGVRTGGMYPDWVATNEGHVAGVLEIKTIRSLPKITDTVLEQKVNTVLPRAFQQIRSVCKTRCSLEIAYIVLDLNSNPDLSNTTQSEMDVLSTIESFFNRINRRVDVVVDVRLWPNRELVKLYPATC